MPRPFDRCSCGSEGDPFGPQRPQRRTLGPWRPNEPRARVGMRPPPRAPCKPSSVTPSEEGAVAIHLGLRSRTGSSDATRGLERAAHPLFGLAPGGVCHARPVSRPPVRPYRTLSPLPGSAGPKVEARPGGLLSVALSSGLPRPGVTRRPCPVELGLSSRPDGPKTAETGDHPGPRGGDATAM